MTSETVNEEMLRKWVNVLRSRRYIQGRNALRTADNQFCCLGVACDIFHTGHWKMGLDDTGAWEFYLGHDVEMFDLPEEISAAMLGGQRMQIPIEVVERFAPELAGNYSDGRVAGLATLNDDGATFAQIADMIEATWL